AEVMLADLSAIVREAVRKRLRLREKEQADVLIGVAREQHDIGWLDIFDATFDVGDTADTAAALVHIDAGRDRLRHDAELAGGDRLRDRAHRGRVLGADVAAAAVAEAVI